MKVALAGSVTSSFVTLEKLIEHQLDVVCVFGLELEQQSTSVVSGYCSMRDLCEKHDILYIPFTKINKDEHIDLLNQLNPDVFFAVGLSQLISEDLLKVAKLGNVGFHPTLLPKGRGRAPIAWLLLNENQGAANFFLMGKGADDGPVFIQEPFDIEDQDDAASVESKILGSIKVALDKWLPSLKRGEWNPIPQDELEVTYYGKRTPEDGWVNWELNNKEVDKLIRASAHPHPGAYSFLKNKKLTILKSRIENNIPIKGVTGRVLLANGQQEYLIQCGSGLIWISDVYEENNAIELRVGQKLGYYTELEIFNLKKQIEELTKKITHENFSAGSSCG